MLMICRLKRLDKDGRWSFISRFVSATEVVPASNSSVTNSAAPACCVPFANAVPLLLITADGLDPNHVYPYEL